MTRHAFRQLLHILAAVSLAFPGTSFAQSFAPPASAPAPLDPAAVHDRLKSGDPLERILAIRQCENLGARAAELMPTLVELLWDQRDATVPDSTVMGRHLERISERARAAFWTLGPIGAPALSVVLHGKDAERASLAAKVLEEALLGKSYDRSRIIIDGGMGGSSFRTPDNRPREPEPTPNYKPRLSAERALQHARFEVWVGTLRDDKMLHGKRPGDGVAILSAELDAYFVNFAPYVTPEKLRALKEGEEWKVLLDAAKASGGEGDRPHPDTNLQITAVRLIGETAGPTALPQLFELLDSPQRGTAEAACGEIAAQGAPAVDDLFAGLINEKPRAKMFVVFALRYITDTQAVPKILAHLKDPHPLIRSNAAESLGHFNDSRALEPLINLLLKDEDRGVRTSAAVGLEQLDDPKMLAGAALIKAVNEDKDGIVRWRAILSLEHKPATWDAGLATLEAVAANDSDERAKEEAKQLVAKIKAAKNPG